MSIRPSNFWSRFHKSDASDWSDNLRFGAWSVFGAWSLVFCIFAAPLRAEVVYEVTSPYHHIRVVDNNNLRILCFDDARESQVSLTDPLKGHFEYTEYFHMAWLWNVNITNVLMIGLGGGSAQRSFVHYHPGVKVQTAEIDSSVLQVARDYFGFQESDAQKVQIEDGRVFLRRSTTKYDMVILDAYVSGRYGSSIPQHLATKEFFEMVRNHLTTNGVVAYNVIGTPEAWHADIVGAIFHTLQTLFPNVYVFRAKTSWNVVVIATRLGPRADLAALRQRAAWLLQTGRVTVPLFRERVESLEYRDPPNAARSPVLTDDFAPVEGLSGAGGNPDRP